MHGAAVPRTSPGAQLAEPSVPLHAGSQLLAPPAPAANASPPALPAPPLVAAPPVPAPPSRQSQLASPHSQLPAPPALKSPASPLPPDLPALALPPADLPALETPPFDEPLAPPFGATAPATPLPPWLVLDSSALLLQPLKAAKVVIAAVEALAEVASEGNKKRARQFAARLAKIGRVTDRAEGLVGLVATVPFGILLLLLYVLRLYPIIPQTFGGGAAYHVRLLVDPAKVSAHLGSRTGFAFKWDKDGSPVLTAPLEILYSTESGLWIRRRPGRVFSLDKSAVLATLPE